MPFQEPDGGDGPPAAFAELPSVHTLAEDAALAHLVERLARPTVVAGIRQVLESYRGRIARGERPPVSRQQILGEVASLLESWQRPALGEAINGTGILLHTGLGRSPLSDRALEAIQQACRGYTPLEIDLTDGRRGRRSAAVAERLVRLTGAEDALVVNNNAAALLLALNTFASGRQAIVSRGELIEIGGSFRLPEVMSASGAQLREVGTTNKTRVSDYEAAIDESTAVLLKVHPSNYQVTGFTESTGIEALVELGRRRGVTVIHDIGSGAMMDLTDGDLADEPVARASVEAGADVVLFSGDKLLGGPQAGILVGRRECIEAMEHNPLTRPLRVGKLTLAALSATLAALEHPPQAIRELPLWQMATASRAQLLHRGGQIREAVLRRGARCEVEVIDSTAFLGGGTLPNRGLESVAVAVRSAAVSDEELARRLRDGAPAVVGRLQNHRLLVDVRTVLPRQDEDLIAALGAALEG